MKVDERRNIDVGDAVAVGHAEQIIAADVAGHPLEPAAGHGVVAGIHQGDPPGLGLIAMIGDAVGRQVDGDVGVVEDVVGEILL